jgi:dipeptidyl aminopeptidase/acylaminoacyl peptidase
MKPLAALLAFLPAVLDAQGTLADYGRASGLRARYSSLAQNIPDPVQRIAGSPAFWYRKTVPGGHEFIRVDPAATPVKQPAFDHEKVAACLAQATAESHTALKFPFSNLTYVQNGQAFEFNLGDSRWRSAVDGSACQRTGPAVTQGPRPGGGPPPARLPADRAIASPDGKWEALVRNYNLVLRPKGKTEWTPLSFEGSEDNAYQINSLAWSPDSSRIAVYRVRPGYTRLVHYVESSPADQLQPKHSTNEYAKPGDVLDLQQPVLFELATKQQSIIDNRLFPNPYQLSRLAWWKDSRAFIFEYNQRGHQLYRVIEVDARTAVPRTVIAEAPGTFFCYSGKRFRHNLDDGKEMVWMSERDGWNHLYLYDAATGRVKNQVTKGNWVVRGVEYVDESKRQILFRASGMDSGEDPYFVHYFRINLDGSRLTRLTAAGATHSAVFTPDYSRFIDTSSRVDSPPVVELRDALDGRKLAALERGDIAPLTAAGWRPPEVISSVARDGQTGIWGVLVRPSNFDPQKKYPVIESIYAGPQDSFVPKSFSAYSSMQSLAELGFIVVQIDGMGTSNRSKAFHDVAWKNLGDAGFPDRKLWHRQVAAKYPWYDVARLGIYGHSAGGQNALGALLFHGDFYQAAVSSCGCHDNRMDKIWWNEQWMGWPLGPEYIACSNVENAHKLKGRLLLSVGEMDSNVDPASTFQVVNALVKAGKTFDLLVLPGQGHSNGGPYGDRKRYDFFVRHLLNVEPPDWNTLDVPLPAPPGPRR